MENKGLEALAALASAAPAPAGATGDASQMKNLRKENASEKPAASGDIASPSTVSNSQHSVTATLPALNATGGVNNSTTTNVQWPQTSNNNNITLPLTPANLALLARLQQQVPQQQATDNSNNMAAMQQLSYLNFLAQQTQAQKSIPQNPVVAAGLGGLAGNQALQLVLAGNPAAAALFQKAGDSGMALGRQVLPAGPAGTTQTTHQTSMPPPKPLAGQPIAASTNATMSSPQQKAMIAPQPGFEASGSFYDESQNPDKKQQKRAANRRSAQLSRKRKKQFIEELKEENDDLRRKEQILRSIPDLIVVFDSSGKLWFVSESVSRFLKFKSTELQGTSFWDRLCVDSVRLLKAAFMDSLAARQADSDTAPLGSGVWELRLVDKDGSQKIVTLNGVVHFAGERPECVCSIRPREEAPSISSDEEAQDSGAAKLESSMPSNRSDSSSEWFSRTNHIKPHQSVVSSFSSDGGTDEPRRKRVRVVGKEAMRISDSNSANSSMESESGSSDELNGNQ
jgi:PAS domain S-box-containing protein